MSDAYLTLTESEASTTHKSLGQPRRIDNIIYRNSTTQNCPILQKLS